LVILFGCSPIPVKVLHVAECAVRFAELAIELESFGCSFFGVLPSLARRHRRHLNSTERVVTVSETHISRRVTLVRFNRTLKQRDRLVEILFGTFVPVEITALQIFVVSLRSYGRARGETRLLVGCHLNAHFLCD